jgi:hypothetical protein
VPRKFILQLVVTEDGKFQVAGNGDLTSAEVIAGLRMYEWQVLGNILGTAKKGGGGVPNFNPRQVS